MNQNFEIDKESTLNQIQIANELIDLILRNMSLNLVNSIQYNKLKEIKNRNLKYQQKLISEEFEVAIVGLEKAGKSTFANALIDNDVLPSAPERCTFTTTRLVSGSDRAIVEFYTETEFEEIFQKMLEEIEYPNAKQISYKSLSKDEFEQYFSGLELKNPNLYKSHQGKTDQEILDILACRNQLQLNGAKQEFIGEQLNQDDFREYIKGRPNDTSKPRSVKSIEIESSKLKQMQNIIMYDVPGFDSPTKLHLRQTEERLKHADAIVLVTNVGTNPSIQGTSLSVIRNNTDYDGIELKDKLFIFGNQIDRVNHANDIQGNEHILRSDVAKYKLAENQRVFVGSALSYLSQEHVSKFIGLDNGIEKIREALISYYQVERFEILKRKINSSYSELKSVLGEIANLNTINGDINIDENHLKSEITYQETKEIEKRLRKQLKDFFADLKFDILEEKWISKRMVEELENEKYFKRIDDEYFEQVQRLYDDSLRLNIQFEQVNREIRKTLHLQYLEQYSEIIRNVTNEECNKIEQNLIWCFAHAVCGTVQVTDNIFQHCKLLIKNISSYVTYHPDYFNYLIERFSRDLFDILLSSPLASHDRLNRYKTSSPDIRYLDHFYSNNQGALINIILAQKENNILDIKDMEKLIMMIYRSMALSPEDGELVNIVNMLIKYKPSFVISDNLDLVAIMNEYGVQSSQTREAVINEINVDLEYLRKILINAVVPAIDLEVAFLNSMDKQIKLLLSSMDNHNQYSKLFNRFISHIVTLVKQDELDNVQQMIEQQKLKKEIIEKISML